ncbi:class I SAM-dependent methyltransferase, partial [candidate division KSB1 bacterium]|nr:class I SAM-dependent methyltransferase [candidate division KSB1 bacterium]NIR69550.1 class I SAM-dependent methyltransferase [candidate division KSB1 bacterium]NIS22860.1 class I SAM-dependent methyltransferase [candidate division KSB1 bacterium]NIT69697.1 class I SAM-dependent methyltransferase [candidate division KSB1 bacterium]NIU23366.1 class I SAM-dependent methyltransferase [candidate division KSB1 bacterium]
WTTSEPTKHMQDCRRFFQSAGVKTVLDVGCGIGIWAIFLSQAGFRVKGFDFSETAINYASDWAKRENLDIQYVCSPLTKVAYPNEQFDAVLAAKVLENVSRDEAEIAIEHISGSLKDGGVVYALFNPHLSEAQIEELMQSDNPTKNITHTIYTDEELKKLFPDFEMMKFKHYDDVGFRGLFLKKLEQ